MVAHMTTVAVTGSTGFIGSAINDAIRAAGMKSKPWVTTEGDARDLFDPAAMAADWEEVDVVVHAAGHCLDSVDGTLAGWTHVAGAENIVKAAQAAGVKRLIAISSCDVTLSTRERSQWSEDRVLERSPLGLRAQTLRDAEEKTAGYVGTLETTVLRAATVWGAGDNRWLPTIANELAAGTFHLCGRGVGFYATTHVENLAAAVIAAIRSAESGGVHHVLDNEVFLARDVFADALDALGSTLDATMTKRRPLFRATTEESARRRYSHSFDARSARTNLGYQATTAFADGMKALRAWVAEIGGPAAVAARLEARSARDAKRLAALKRYQATL